MNELLEQIKEKAYLLTSFESDIDLDKALGEIEGLVREARQAIDAEWRAQRAGRPSRKIRDLDFISHIDLEDLDL